MRQVEWTDRAGYNHRSLVRDNDPDDMAEQGIPLDPPDLNQIDWEMVRRDLHNALLHNEMVKWDDIPLRPNGISNAIKTSMKRQVVNLYRDRR